MERILGTCDVCHEGDFVVDNGQGRLICDHCMQEIQDELEEVHEEIKAADA